MTLTTLFGTLNRPSQLQAYDDVEAGGLGQLVNLMINVLIAIAGLYAMFNFIIAGYEFLSSGGDPKKIQTAWAKIWQSLLGLIVVAISIAIASLIGVILFGNSDALLRPIIYLP